ncbi:DUF262 domain-containing protein [Timonella senegalensis]|uniref:DUF262 domain-containing protein n=2 Tax=Timonella senegalensis TaxID=1465825 RepID=UPI002FDDDF60
MEVMSDAHIFDEEFPETSPLLTAEEEEDLSFPASQPPEVSYMGQDFDVEGLVRRLDRGDIVVPSFGDVSEDIETAGFQRGFVWNRSQMDRFIESLLMGYPIPGIFLVRQGDGKMLVLDGQQRLRTLQHFYRGTFNDKTFRLSSVAERFKGLSYNELSDEMRRSIDNTFIQATIVTAKPDADNMDAIYQIFERLNSGGTQLTAHEIRVALFAGPIIDYLEDLNRDQAWRALYGKKNARIRDQELVARILAMFIDGEHYARPLKTFLNSFLDRNRRNVLDETRKAGTLFKEAASLLNKQIGPESLRRASRQVNNAWTDALFYGLMKRIQTGTEISPTEINDVFNELRSNEDMQEASTGPSADEDRVSRRLTISAQAFSPNQ